MFSLKEVLIINFKQEVQLLLIHSLPGELQLQFPGFFSGDPGQEQWPWGSSPGSIVLKGAVVVVL